jgi:hypothetical protein
MQHVATEFTSVSLKHHDLPRVILRASFASEVQSAMIKLSDCQPVAVVRGVTLHRRVLTRCNLVSFGTATIHNLLTCPSQCPSWGSVTHFYAIFFASRARKPDFTWTIALRVSDIKTRPNRTLASLTSHTMVHSVVLLGLIRISRLSVIRLLQETRHASIFRILPAT